MNDPWNKVIHVLIGMVLVLLLFACGPQYGPAPSAPQVIGADYATILVKNRSGGPVELYIRGPRERSLRVYPPSECISVRGTSGDGHYQLGLRVLADTRPTWSDHPVDLSPGQGWLLVVNGWRHERQDLVSISPIARCDGQRTVERGFEPNVALNPGELVDQGAPPTVQSRPGDTPAVYGVSSGLGSADAPNSDRSRFRKSLHANHLPDRTTYNTYYVTFGVENRPNSFRGRELQRIGRPRSGISRPPGGWGPPTRPCSRPPLQALGKASGKNLENSAETKVWKFSKQELFQ